MLSETLLTLRTEQNIFINIHTSTFKLSVILVRLIKLEFSRQIFLKTHTKFHENLSSGNRVVLRGRTRRHDEADSIFILVINQLDAQDFVLE